MTIILAGIVPSPRRLRADPSFAVTTHYRERTSPYAPCKFEHFPDQASLLRAMDQRAGRTAIALVLLDTTGRRLSSEQFAREIAKFRDTGRRQLMAAVGPADGWSAASLARADLILSLGPMTLPHALAQAVLAEQIYRAFTILAGHPYHSGH